MALEKIELDKKLLEYSLSQFRNIPEYVAICEAIAQGMGTIQDGVDYLSNMLDIDKAEGVWLDYIGALVGEVRSEYIDTDKYFCANAEDVNKSKFFYFPNSSGGGSGVSLGDDLFKGQIKAKIAYNCSNGTREDLIKIIKYLVNADHVIITKVYSNKWIAQNNDVIYTKVEIPTNITVVYSDIDCKNNIGTVSSYSELDNELVFDNTNYEYVERSKLIPMQLSILLYGTNILTINLQSRIESVLPNGVCLTGYPDILEISYTDIETQINEIVDMNYISPLDQSYTYEVISNDLDEILEINND